MDRGWGDDRGRGGWRRGFGRKFGGHKRYSAPADSRKEEEEFSPRQQPQRRFPERGHPVRGSGRGGRGFGDARGFGRPAQVPDVVDLEPDENEHPSVPVKRPANNVTRSRPKWEAGPLVVSDAGWGPDDLGLCRRCRPSSTSAGNPNHSFVQASANLSSRSNQSFNRHPSFELAEPADEMDFDPVPPAEGEDWEEAGGPALKSPREDRQPLPDPSEDEDNREMERCASVLMDTPDCPEGKMKIKHLAKKTGLSCDEIEGLVLNYPGIFGEVNGEEDGRKKKIALIPTFHLCAEYAKTRRCGDKKCSKIHGCPRYFPHYKCSRQDCPNGHDLLTPHNKKVLRKVLQLPTVASLSKDFVKKLTFFCLESDDEEDNGSEDMAVDESEDEGDSRAQASQKSKKTPKKHSKRAVPSNDESGDSSDDNVAKGKKKKGKHQEHSSDSESEGHSASRKGSRSDSTLVSPEIICLKYINGKCSDKKCLNMHSLTGKHFEWQVKSFESDEWLTLSPRQSKELESFFVNPDINKAMIPSLRAGGDAPTEKLEKLLKPMVQWEADFDSMTASFEGQEFVALRRVGSMPVVGNKGNPGETKWFWYFDNEGTWTKYGEETRLFLNIKDKGISSDEIEAHFLKEVKRGYGSVATASPQTAALNADPFHGLAKLRFKMKFHEYDLDFDVMKQVNVAVQRTRDIRRRPI